MHFVQRFPDDSPAIIPLLAVPKTRSYRKSKELNLHRLNSLILHAKWSSMIQKWINEVEKKVRYTLFHNVRIQLNDRLAPHLVPAQMAQLKGRPGSASATVILQLACLHWPKDQFWASSLRILLLAVPGLIFRKGISIVGRWRWMD